MPHVFIPEPPKELSLAAATIAALNPVALAASTITALAKSGTLISAPNQTVGSGALTTVFVANTARRAAIIRALSTNTGPVYIKEAVGAAIQGIILYPGDSVTLHTSAAIGAFQTTGTAQYLTRLEIRD